MSENHHNKTYFLPVAVLAILIVLFSIAGAYLANEEQQSRISKAQTVARQVTISLEVFSKERMQALHNLMQNWPTFEPNQVDWFNAQAVSLMGMQGGFSSLALVDANQQIRWITVPGSGSHLRVDNGLSGQPVQALGISSLQLTEQFKSVLVLGQNNQHYYLVTGRAISPQEPEHGFVVASFDVATILDMMLGELVGPEFTVRVQDGDTTLFTSGSIIHDGSAISPPPVSFAGRNWNLTLQTRPTPINAGLLVTLVGALMSLIITWIFHQQIKGSVSLTVSQQRYQTASDAALDALLIFKSVGQDFILVEANKFSYSLFQGLQPAFKTQRLSAQLDYLGLLSLQPHIHAVAHNGDPFEDYIENTSDHIDARWLKVQVVKAANNVAITIRDVSERFKAQFALQDSEERYRRLLDNMHGHFVYTRTATHRFSYVSAGVAKILGYSTDDFCQYAHLLVQQIPDNALEIRQQLKAGDKPAPYLMHYLGVSGQLHVIEFADTPVLSNEGELLAIEGIARDVTVEQKLHEEVAYQASHDQLTGLMNRYAFDQQLKSLLNDIRHNEQSGVMCFVDMDRFKLVNDSCGHPAGDRLLQEIAEVFRQRVGRDDLLARIGGDEFCIIFRNATLGTVKKHLDALLQAISDYRFIHDDKLFYVGASIGVIDLQYNTSNPAELIKAADNACYQAKHQGRNRYFIFSDGDMQSLNLQTENHVLQTLHQAIAQDGFELYCQPIIPLQNEVRDKAHYEILLRLPVPMQDSVISPALFIPLAERHGLMNKIDWWVVDKTLRELEHEPDYIGGLGKVAINLSGLTLGDQHLMDKIIQRVRQSSVPPECICFEITETTAVTNLTAARSFMTALRQAGCQFALDDFGAGMSSFTYLKNLDVDYVKIDGSFVRNMATDPIDFETVKAISDIAHSMGKQTVAEFVIDDATCHALRTLNVDFGQGYALGKPVPLSDYLEKTHQKATGQTGQKMATIDRIDQQQG